MSGAWGGSTSSSQASRAHWPARARRALGLVAVLVLAAFPAQALLVKWLVWLGHWLAQPPRVRQADAIVVLGGNMERIHQGIALYHQGLAPELWHTGDAPISGESTIFARFAARLAVEKGVPARSIHLLATASTWEDGQKVVALARERDVASILVVTDWYHSRRALSVLVRQAATGQVSGLRSDALESRDLRPVIYYAPSTGIAYSPENWWRYQEGWADVLGEVVKMCFYRVRYGVLPW